MASPTRWTWVWVNSRSWWWTGRPGVLQSVGSQTVRHNWASELNWTELKWDISCSLFKTFNIVNISFLPNLMYCFNTVLNGTYIPSSYFVDIDKLILNLYGKAKDGEKPTQYGKQGKLETRNLKKKKRYRGIYLQNRNKVTDVENKLIVTRVNYSYQKRERAKLENWNWHIPTTV